MAANTAVVAQAVSTARARAGAAVMSLTNPPPIFPIVKSMGPAIYALDVAALATRPWWYILNYNGPLSPVTARNRAIVWTTWGRLMATAPAFSQLDEFPYASTVQGGVGAVAAPVPWLENAVQGGLLGAFYRFSLKSKPAAPFLVVPIPL